VLLLVVAGVAGCGKGDAGTSPTTTEAADVPTDAADAPSTPVPIPEVEGTAIAHFEGPWRGLKGVSGRLFMYRPFGADIELARVDPDTGEVAARRAIPVWEGWTLSAHGVVVLEKDQRVVHVLDLETLATRHRIQLPSDARASIGVDLPRSDPFWLGLRRYDVDQLAGVLTRMGAVRLDLAAGTVEEIIDLPACGAAPAIQVDDEHLVVGIACINQVGIVDRATGEVDLQESFQVNPQMLAYDGTAWLRWKPWDTSDASAPARM